MEINFSDIDRNVVHSGTEIIPRKSIVYSKIWSDNWSNLTVAAFIAFVDDYNDVSFEFSSGMWIIRYNKTYRTLHNGDAVIVGYKELLVLSEEEYMKCYREL